MYNKAASHRSLVNRGSAGFASTQGPDIPYSGVQVTPHTTDQAVSTNNSQHPLNNPEARKKKRKLSMVKRNPLAER